jgi:leader peptidase (prepilin peptidase)/N-methyltransferase
LPPQHLVPLLSYLALRGRCGFCSGRIASEHVLAEVGGGMIGLIALVASPDLAGMAGAIFGWMLLALALLDAKHFWLPDALTLPLACAGVAFGVLGIAPSLADRLIGVAVGTCAFLAIGFIYRKLRAREGLGQGDAKLMAAIGAWLGWAALPFVILGAGTTGLIWALIAHCRGNNLHMASRLPLGSLLALSAWLIWLATTLSAERSPLF